MFTRVFVFGLCEKAVTVQGSDGKRNDDKKVCCNMVCSSAIQ